MDINIVPIAEVSFVNFPTTDGVELSFFTDISYTRALIQREVTTFIFGEIQDGFKTKKCVRSISLFRPKISRHRKIRARIRSYRAILIQEVVSSILKMTPGQGNPEFENCISVTIRQKDARIPSHSQHARTAENSYPKQSWPFSELREILHFSI